MLGLLFFYFLPTVIALVRETPKIGGVLVVNLFLGWTFIGWIVALAWAVSAPGPSPKLPLPDKENRIACPQCAELILAAAKKCHFCQFELPVVHAEAALAGDVQAHIRGMQLLIAVTFILLGLGIIVASGPPVAGAIVAGVGFLWLVITIINVWRHHD